MITLTSYRHITESSSALFYRRSFGAFILRYKFKVGLYISYPLIVCKYCFEIIYILINNILETLTLALTLTLIFTLNLNPGLDLITDYRLSPIRQRTTCDRRYSVIRLLNVSKCLVHTLYPAEYGR